MRSRIREFDSSTLNESVQNTIMRDLKAVGKKFMHVLYPRKSNTLLRDWDLWGPLILCVTLALMLQRGSVDSEKDGGPQFAEVFVIVWFGAVTITLNSKLLGGNISFFQSLCVLGYCILPLTVAMLVCRLVLLTEPGPINFMVRLFVVIVMFAWSIVGLRHKRSLKSLVADYLRRIIQDDGHNSSENATAFMELVLWKLFYMELQVDH
ncbi:protein YIPF6 isoform X5 [Orcinus orca]|nr:protein YIPF6 isoform X5 [Orcinus orca]XP_049560609.1 protein YIPF6 isoform X5 [Orcinus orca]